MEFLKNLLRDSEEPRGFHPVSNMATAHPLPKPFGRGCREREGHGLEVRLEKQTQGLQGGVGGGWQSPTFLFMFVCPSQESKSQDTR